MSFLRAFKGVNLQNASRSANLNNLAVSKRVFGTRFGARPVVSARFFSNTPVEKKDEEIQWGDPAPVEDPANKLGIFEKYGAAPIIGFGLAIALSKELLLLSEELVIVLTFSSFVTTTYFASADTVNQTAKEQYDEALAEFNRLYDDNIKAAQDLIDVHQSFVDSVKDNAGMMDYYIELQKRMEEAVHIRLHHALRLEFVERLNKLAQTEAEMFRSNKSLLLDQAANFARKKFAGAPQKVRAGYLDLVIQGLKSQNPTAAMVPVSKVFKAYFKKFQKAQQESRNKERVFDEKEIQGQRELIETMKAQGQQVPDDWKPISKAKLLF